MATTDLYIDAFNQILISGLSGQPANLPNLFQGDDPTFRIFPCLPKDVVPNSGIQPFSFIGIAGLSLQVAIGQKKGTGGTVYTSQLTWAPSADPNNPTYFTATLPMNTGPINTALGANATITDGYFQVVYLQGGIQTTILEIPCTINASVIQNGGVVVPPGLTPVSLEYANATFLTRVISGGVTLFNPNTLKKAFLYLGDDNTLHCDPIN